jgi:hypothetical protein
LARHLHPDSERLGVIFIWRGVEQFGPLPISALSFARGYSNHCFAVSGLCRSDIPLYERQIDRAAEAKKVLLFAGAQKMLVLPCFLIKQICEIL